jgi:hypothetical protein
VPLPDRGTGDAHRERLWAANGGVLLFLVLAAGMPLYVYGARPEFSSQLRVDEPSAVTVAAQVLVIVLSAARLAHLYVTGRPKLLLLTFHLYVYVFLGIAPLSQLLTGRAPGRAAIPESVQLPLIGIVLVGTLAYEGGRLLRRSREATAGASGPRRTTVPMLDFDRKRILLLAVVGLAFAAYYVASVGPSSFLESRASSRQASQGALGEGVGRLVITALGTVPVLIAVLGILDLRRRGYGRYTPLLLLLLVPTLLIANPVGASRFWFAVVIGTLFVVGLRMAATPRRFRVFLVLATTALVLVFPYADRYRNISGEQGAQPSVAEQYASKLDYDSYAQIGVARRYVLERGHTNGRQALGAVLAPVPREYWESKPRDTGIVLGQYAGYSFLSISAPLWAEAYLDGGWVFLVVVFVGLGYVSAYADAAYRLALQRGSALVLALVPTFAFYQVMSLRGSFLQQSSRLLLFAFCFWFVADRIGRRREVRESRRSELLGARAARPDARLARLGRRLAPVPGAARGGPVTGSTW